MCVTVCVRVFVRMSVYDSCGLWKEQKQGDEPEQEKRKMEEQMKEMRKKFLRKSIKDLKDGNDKEKANEIDNEEYLSHIDY